MHISKQDWENAIQVIKMKQHFVVNCVGADVGVGIEVSLSIYCMHKNI